MNNRQRYLAKAKGQEADGIPIWIMRQAGRYLPEYRKIRENHSFEQVAKNPSLAAEVTLQPIHNFDLDAAIIFSDILFILEPLGVKLTFDPGPRLSNLLTKPEQARAFRTYDASKELAFVGEAISETRNRLGEEIALLGFAGGPFTVFCYLCGLSSPKEFYKVWRFLLRHPQESSEVLDLLATISIQYLQMQLEAGADAVQIFDTWAGELSEEEYVRWAHPYLMKIVDALRQDNAIVSLYIKGSHHLLDRLTELDITIFNPDWRTPLHYAASKLNGKTLQGNLNPHVLLGPKEMVISKTLEILESMKDYPGYIFNLGHGILPQTPVENVQTLVETVHGYTR